MEKDIVEQLREEIDSLELRLMKASKERDGYAYNLDQFRREAERLREALRQIANGHCGDQVAETEYINAIRVARSALSF